MEGTIDCTRSESCLGNVLTICAVVLPQFWSWRKLNGRNFAFDCSGTSRKKQGIFLENQLFYELINWKRTKFKKDA